MEWLELDTANCSVQRTLDVIGDRWSLLILREAFNGVRRSDDLAGHLAISESVLARRLRSLVDAGVLERHAYRLAGERARHDYRLTVRGLELLPVIVALMQWGDRHLADAEGGSWTVTHRDCGHPAEAVVRCRHDHQDLEAGDTSTAAGPAAKALT